MLVELDIFSGRPNPTWELDERASGRLREAHAALLQTTVPPPELPGLGYRGFVYRLDDVAWRAFRGSVSNGRRTLADPDRSIERLFAGWLPAELADLRVRIFSELEPGG
jgi:hypothetical protein